MRDWVLAIETSAAETAVAVASVEGSVIAEATVAGMSHSETLAMLVERLRAEHALEFQSLRAIVLGQGPGSFTGLRIGFSFAKGLAFSRRCSLTLVPSFAAAAREFTAKADVIFVARDARREEVFWQEFRAGPDGSLASLREVRIEPIHALREIVQQRLRSENCTGERALLVGQGELPDVGLVREQPQRSGWGVLQCWREGGVALRSFDMSALIAAEPVYLREVAAKTIAERAAVRG